MSSSLSQTSDKVQRVHFLSLKVLLNILENSQVIFGYSLISSDKYISIFAFAKIIVLSESFSLDHLSNQKYSIFSIIEFNFIIKSLFFLFAITSRGKPQTQQNGSQTLDQGFNNSTFAISTIFQTTFLGVKNCPIHFTQLSLFKNVS